MCDRRRFSQLLWRWLCLLWMNICSCMKIYWQPCDISVGIFRLWPRYFQTALSDLLRADVCATEVAGQAAARQLIRFLSRGPRKFVGAMYITRASSSQSSITSKNGRATDTTGGDGAIFGPTRISGPTKQPARPKCGACPMRLHGVRATWQRALFVSTLPRTIRIIRRHKRATPRRPDPWKSADPSFE